MRSLIILYLIFTISIFAQAKRTTIIFGFIQPVYSFNFTNDMIPNNEFKINRVRLGIENRFLDYLKGEIEIDPLDNNIIKDVRVNFNVLDGFEIVIGRQKVPFSYERLTSVKNIPFLERSKIVKELDQLGYCGRDVGIQFLFSKSISDLDFNLMAGIFNGNSGIPAGDNNNSKSFSQRLEISKGKKFRIGFNSSQKLDSLSAKYFLANGFDFSFKLLKSISITSEFLYGKKNSEISIGGFYSLVEYELSNFTFGLRFSQYYKDLKKKATNFYEAKIDFNPERFLRFHVNIINEQKNQKLESNLLLGISYEI